MVADTQHSHFVEQLWGSFMCNSKVHAAALGNELLLQQNDTCLSMLQRFFVLSKLAEYRTKIQASTSGIHHSTAIGLNAKSPLKVLQRDPEPALSPVVARQVVVSHGADQIVAASENLGLSQQPIRCL
jgi:hypothetical protein